eukprot:TRINITY_DN5745_c0_g1_i3.p1 TRINITY_DN5745_c0_g1~~TRINITY_DN5745_c0_g1_i3.p1  ORF type:complete len:605 (+),score=125.74 TRINITY_DN5745_c0_g1_i3:1728-3542(+)
MLIYIRKSDRPKYLSPCDEIPPQLLARFKKEQEDKYKKELEREDELSKIHIKLVLESQMIYHGDYDLVPEASYFSLKVARGVTMVSLKKEIHLVTRIPVDCIRLWSWEKRRNNTRRPDSFPLSSRSISKNCVLYVEEIPSEMDVGTKRFLLFYLKFYDPFEENLIFIGKYYSPPDRLIYDILPEVRYRMSLDKDEELLVWEEISLNRVDILDPFASLRSLELANGDILVFQKKDSLSKHPIASKSTRSSSSSPTITPITPRSPRQSQQQPQPQPQTSTPTSPSPRQTSKTPPPFRNMTKVPPTPRNPTLKDYFGYLSNRCTTNFVSRCSDHQGFSLELSREHTLSDVLGAVARSLQVEPTKVGLFSSNNLSELPLTAEKQHQDQFENPNLIYYETFDFPVSLLPNMVGLRVAFRDVEMKTRPYRHIYLPRNSTVQKVFDKLIELKDVEFTTQEKTLHLFGMKEFHPSERLDADEKIVTVDEMNRLGHNQWIVEEVTHHLKKINPGDKLVPVVQYVSNMGVLEHVGPTFFFLFCETEQFGLYRQKLAQKLNISKTDFDKYQVFYLDASYHVLCKVDDEDIVARMKFRFLGLQGTKAKETGFRLRF